MSNLKQECSTFDITSLKLSLTDSLLIERKAGTNFNSIKNETMHIPANISIPAICPFLIVFFLDGSPKKIVENFTNETRVPKLTI